MFVALLPVCLTLIGAHGYETCAQNEPGLARGGMSMLQARKEVAIDNAAVQPRKEVSIDSDAIESDAAVCEKLVANRKASIIQMGIERGIKKQAGVGSSAALNAQGFVDVTSMCCPHEMEEFFNRLLNDRGLDVCSKHHVQGLMHWFTCTPKMDFQYVLDVIENGNPCKFWAPIGQTCPVLSAECAGHWCDEAATVAETTTKSSVSSTTASPISPTTTKASTTETSTESPTSPTTTKMPTDADKCAGVSFTSKGTGQCVVQGPSQISELLIQASPFVNGTCCIDATPTCSLGYVVPGMGPGGQVQVINASDPDCIVYNGTSLLQVDDLCKQACCGDSDCIGYASRWLGPEGLQGETNSPTFRVFGAQHPNCILFKGIPTIPVDSTVAGGGNKFGYWAYSECMAKD